MSKNSFKRLNRTIHYWGALLCAIPIVIVIITGVLLLLKKDIEWVQPASARGVGNHPVISFERIINSVRSTHNGADVEWADINRLDVRPGKGLVKVRLKNNWEIQIDATNGHILAENYRRSDIIEAIHDGSFFHEKAKLGVFLPSAIILFVLWMTGIYLFVVTEISKYKKRKRYRFKRELGYEAD